MPNKQRYSLQCRYGITEAHYKALLKAQYEMCMGCEKHISLFKKRFAVDHDHDTNVIRGLLCYKCNMTLGWAQDSSLILRNLSNYIDKTC